jgi:hypothetical protein
LVVPPFATVGGVPNRSMFADGPAIVWVDKFHVVERGIFSKRREVRIGRFMRH